MCYLLLPDYELVRIYHPDSPTSRHIPPEKAQARFQAITSAYDALRGKTPLSDTGEPLQGHVHARRPDYHDLSTAVWKLKQRRRADLSVGMVDDKWKDRILLSVVVLVRLHGSFLRLGLVVTGCEDVLCLM